MCGFQLVDEAFHAVALEARLLAVDQFVFCSHLVYFLEPQSFSQASTLLRMPRRDFSETRE